MSLVSAKMLAMTDSGRGYSGYVDKPAKPSGTNWSAARTTAAKPALTLSQQLQQPLNGIPDVTGALPGVNDVPTVNSPSPVASEGGLKPSGVFGGGKAGGGAGETTKGPAKPSDGSGGSGSSSLGSASAAAVANGSESFGSYSDIIDLINQTTKANNDWAAAEAQKNRDFQLMMSNTAHQREMADLKAAGLNPVLTATGGSGASTGSGAVAQPDTSNTRVLAEVAMAGLQAAQMNAKTLGKAVEAIEDRGAIGSRLHNFLTWAFGEKRAEQIGAGLTYSLSRPRSIIRW